MEKQITNLTLSDGTNIIVSAERLKDNSLEVTVVKDSMLIEKIIGKDSDFIDAQLRHFGYAIESIVLV